ncbi:alkaline shock response membrane anchor protein AmaP [Liquorilactobacillus oeni]|uniref:Alkaline shock response membrane anchor protein AmaP n=1 Tax=Liquorilactobacillus oeni DSM 19972 TaxID=1423777 RepID=A0A0R1MAK4_9LACO|nr:alkaline shock response membrane anchor protein AmaP [Liquorilactobacillus oeni]KRL05167.1 hypothetical protein FD46_GL001118 [Liquorilactobacillus oeni DSM 19972]
MSTTRKTVYLILLLVALLPLWAVIVLFQDTVSFPFYLDKVESYPLIGHYLPGFLFWVSVALGGLVILGILTVIFWPNLHDQLFLKKDSGVLKINKKALESFITQSALRSNFIHQPRVRIKLQRRRIRVTIDGSFSPVVVLPEESRQFQIKLAEQLGALLNAPKEGLEITVRLNNLYKERENLSRVE